MKPYTTIFTLRTFHVMETDGFKVGQPVRSAEDMWHYCRAMFDEMDADKEHFLLLSLNNKNKVNGHKFISTGSLTASLVHPREAMKAALDLGAAALIFAHNHPSGDPAPSPEDIEITKRLKECCTLFGIRLLDHVVIGRDRFFSFSERGLL